MKLYSKNLPNFMIVNIFIINLLKCLTFIMYTVVANNYLTCYKSYWQCTICIKYYISISNKSFYLPGATVKWIDVNAVSLPFFSIWLFIEFLFLERGGGKGVCVCVCEIKKKKLTWAECWIWIFSWMLGRWDRNQ